jgi:hypothetical protein
LWEEKGIRKWSIMLANPSCGKGRGNKKKREQKGQRKTRGNEDAEKEGQNASGSWDGAGRVMRQRR